MDRPWPAGLHELHCRDDRCVYGCYCPCHRGEPVPRLPSRWSRLACHYSHWLPPRWVWMRWHNLTWHRQRHGLSWPGTVWAWAWTRGTFSRRFWTVMIIGLVVYVAADLIAAAVAT